MTQDQSTPSVAPMMKSGRSHWRTTLQVPLLLAAAAGLGFAGQQMWQSHTTGTKLFHNSAGEFQCPIAALFGCNAKPEVASSPVGCSLAENCSATSAEGCSAGDDCCAKMLQAFEAVVVEEAPVSALTPVNAVETL